MSLPHARRTTPPATAAPGDTTDFAALAARLRELQHAFTAAAPPEDVVGAAVAHIEQATNLLREWSVGESEQLAGTPYELPGRRQVLVPPYLVDESDEVSYRGRVTFGRLYLGRNGAVHGGAIALFWEAILGRLGSSAVPARAAYLNTNYRAVTPIDRELTFTSRIVRNEGRKLFISGKLTDGETLCSDAESLVIILRPGQQ